MKKLLVISNEPFSTGLSNGRTLMNFVLTYEKKALAQFYIHGTPQEGFCKKLFCVSDRAALNALLRKKEKPAPVVAGVKPASGVTIGNKPVRNNCRNRFLRDQVWMTYAWWGREFQKFLDDFRPEIVLLQAGDAPFMFAIARRIARNMVQN